jgi:hypothetical protein
MFVIALCREMVGGKTRFALVNFNVAFESATICMFFSLSSGNAKAKKGKNNNNPIIKKTAS